MTEYKFPQKIYFNAILKKIAMIITTNTKNGKVSFIYNDAEGTCGL